MPALNLTGEELRGYAVLFSAASRAFAFEPDVELMDATARMARAAGAPEVACAAEALASSDEALQHYYDRLLVPSSGCFVALREGCVRGSHAEGRSVHYAVPSSTVVSHLLGCYEAVGFDWRLVEACEVTAPALKPDSLAVELSFMGALALQASEHAAAGGRACECGRASAEGGSDDAARPLGVCEQLLCRFAREHACRWFGRATEYLSMTEDDLYARLCALVSQAAESLAVGE